MAAGYLTDVEYTGDFYQHLAPAWLAYIAAINGYAAPRLGERFTYCELGCGRGVTSLILAATHPSGEFHACDFNPAHIEYAERVRRASAVDNLKLYLSDFAQMAGADLPSFDFIALHGVYSWVPEAARADIREFVRTRLKPGGLLMLSYNAMPGWAHLQPIRQMMQAYAAGLPGDSLEKARAAFAYVGSLARQGAAYFRMLPAAAAHLESIARQDIRYVAHEYLTEHGDPYYFSEIESAMRGIGLAFAGSMTPADNYPELVPPPPLTRPGGARPVRTMLEMHRDFVLNTAFRQDLYAAQPAQREPAVAALQQLACVDFCLTGLGEELPLAKTGTPLQFDLQGQHDSVRAVHARLDQGPASAEALHRAVGRGQPEQTARLIQQLVVARHLAPCPPVRTAPGWMKVNAALVRDALREQWQRVPLACPATGSASYCEVVHAASIEAAARFQDAGAAANSVLAQLSEHRHPVNTHLAGGEKRPATDDEVLEYAAATWRSLSDANSRDARLVRLLGILV